MRALPLFVATIFLNALVLFAVQPLFSKLILPLLGGTPAVWNSCLLFFQAVLLAGYLYSHAATRWLTPRIQRWVHVGLLLLTLLLLPVSLNTDWTPPADWHPVAWVLALLTVSLGIPFFALSTGAPLLQRWFSQTGHPHAHNPYFLYSASNLGSFVALLGYPLLAEPMVTLSDQTLLWSAGYAVVVALVALCAFVTWRADASAPDEDAAFATAPGSADPSLRGTSYGSTQNDMDVSPRASEASRGICTSSPLPPVTNRTRTRWILLSLVPSSLLVGVTTHITTDIAAVPLLWVLPLALYLLTFVIVFARRQLLPHRLMLQLHLILLVPLLLTITLGSRGEAWTLVPLHLAVFFVTAIVCHGELAQGRPPVTHLTEFYLWIAAGGVLGSIVNVLAAPLLFDRPLEYPLMLVAACALRPRLDGPAASQVEAEERVTRDFMLPALLGMLVYVLSQLPLPDPPWEKFVTYSFIVLVYLLILTFRQRPLRLALGAAAILAAGILSRPPEGDLVFRERSFFGVYEVRQNGRFHLLTHGTTLHGGQSLNPDFRREPLTYYHSEGPLAQLFNTHGDSTVPRNVAVVGLGTGTAACHANPGDTWTFYEIDPLVARIATDTSLFSYLADCAPDAGIVIGDARLELAATPDSSIDILVLDAFSSDAIPVHLITREALDIYSDKLAPDGVIAFHVSNRYLHLQPVVAELARDARMAGASATDAVYTEAQRLSLRNRSYWVILANEASALASLTRLPGWDPLSPGGEVALWTDDYSNILEVFRFN